MTSIIGHEKIISFFEALIARNALAQSYCFVGKDMVGKKTVATHLAAQLLQVTEQKLSTHPDFYYLSRDVDEKTGKFKKEISISQTRKIKERLGNGSWFGSYQVVIIDEAELLNEESGNALLKMLEEGKNKRVFFLLTEDDGRLLATIKSRCQLMHFSLVSSERIAAGLMQRGCESSLAADLAQLSWGRPGKAIYLYEHAEERLAYAQEVTRWETILTEPFYKKITSTEDLFAESDTDSQRTAEKLYAVLETWQVIWRNAFLDKLVSGHNGIMDKSNLSHVAYVRLIDRLKQSQTLLGQNVNPKLIIEQILLSFN